MLQFKECGFSHFSHSVQKVWILSTLLRIKGSHTVVLLELFSYQADWEMVFRFLGVLGLSLPGGA